MINLWARTMAVAIGVVWMLVFAASTARADNVGPVQVQIRELPSGAIDVRWSVPKVVAPRSMPSPRLPANCRPDGERAFDDQPNAWLLRQTFLCPDGLAGQEVGLTFPGYNIGLSTLLRLELLSGDRYAHFLEPGEDAWQVPQAGADRATELYRDAQEAVVEGIRHFFGGWIHVAFLVVVCLLGGTRARALATAFFLAQIVAVFGVRLLGVPLQASLAEIGLALATVLLATQALRRPEQRRQLAILAACAGTAHGLGIQSFVSTTGFGVGLDLVFTLLFVLGMDAALLVSVVSLSAVGRWVPAGLRAPRVSSMATYAAASLAVALAIGYFAAGPTTVATERRLELPRIPSSSAGGAPPGSRRLATNMPDAAIQSFVSIEAFEVRHEILVRLKDVAQQVGVESGPEIAVEHQEEIKERVRSLVLEHTSIALDSEQPVPSSQRVDFLTLDDKGVLPRPSPVPEAVDSAWVGVTAAYLTPETTQTLSLHWKLPEGVLDVPATVTDPETTRSWVLTPDESVLRWDNELAEDPVPRVSTTVVEPIELVVPLGSLVALLAALAAAFAVSRRHKAVVSGALLRVLLAGTVLLAPVGNMALALPSSLGSAPKEVQAKRILARILPNIYRAFEFREESAVFDRLAMAVTGDTLTEIYVDHRRVLEMAERGGARARVEAVEMIEVDSIEPDGSGGFLARAVWNIGGTVTHFGHRHFRQNRYDARIHVVPDDGIWKVQSIETLDQQRLR